MGCLTDITPEIVKSLLRSGMPAGQPSACEYSGVYSTGAGAANSFVGNPLLFQ
jgi:hypothetical protein